MRCWLAGRGRGSGCTATAAQRRRRLAGCRHQTTTPSMPWAEPGLRRKRSAAAPRRLVPRGFSMAAVFADLNVPGAPERKSLQSLLEAAAHLGYSTVAINHVIDFKEKKQEIVKPISPSELFPSLPIVQGKSKPIKIVTRLTLVVSDPSHCNVLRSTSTNIRLYDIIAVFPETEKLFHVACTNLDVDLICVNVTEKLPFYFRRSSVNMNNFSTCHLYLSTVVMGARENPQLRKAIDRGVYFELLYTPAIKDSTMRRYTISNALSLMQICKRKNIIISSAAERPLELRGPYDVANLGLLFGLSESDAKAAISTNCRAVLLHGETRKTAFGVVYTKKTHRASEEEGVLPVRKKAKTEV
ncbi:ribonuclease P protein subunit p30 isoform X1 [Gopherus evgoodei]|uniref:ribonuclease P protein subunit p30 isoform X1 n=1 Tax=Gopherus evgoodei TaxID=1825980 RepID=UPI0011CF3B94|nr:ribonuclease P protein subunit p30 isoform X1 [Gopherus evgoodei]